MRLFLVAVTAFMLVVPALAESNPAAPVNGMAVSPFAVPASLLLDLDLV
jgi:hypothetical protein